MSIDPCHLFIPRKNSLQGKPGREKEYADQMANWLEIERVINNPACKGGAGLRFATKVVAAHDSLDTAKNHADYVCTGTNDQATINTAIQALPLTGGKVLLMEGHYMCQANLSVTGAEIALRNGVCLEGMGAGTIIQFINGFTSVATAWLVGGISLSQPSIRNLALNVNTANNPGANIGAFFFQGCTAPMASDLWVNDANHNIPACEFALTGPGGTPDKGGVITRCYVQNGDIQVVGDAGQAFRVDISANTVEGGGITVNNAAYVSITGNTVYSYLTTTGYGIYMFEATAVQVSGNVVEECQVGIFLDAVATGCNFVGNEIVRCQHEGIQAFSCTDCTFVGNLIRDCGQAAANTYNAIAVGPPGGAALRTFVQGNTVRGLQHSNALTFGGTSTDALVVDNDVKHGWTTAGYVNAGVGTINNLDGSANNWNRL
jgi:hypothetical protein